jgi:homoserine dehydrogenase
MSAAVPDAAVSGKVTLLRPLSAPRQARLALLGTGTVGTAFVQRYLRLRDDVRLPPLTLIANSRDAQGCNGDVHQVLRSLATSARRHGAVELDPEAFVRGDIVVDASASDEVAGRHAQWLRRGVHVVTANKLGMGAALQRAQDIAAAQREGRARYGDAATVGAGLPLIRSIRELIRGGDRIHSIEGVLSGSLAWLFNHYDGMRPFSRFVREARTAGYTEPDPRIDLSGEDVRRKLLILARAAGTALAAEDIRVDSLVPEALAQAQPEHVDAQLPLLDTDLRERYQQAYRAGAKLRFVGRFRIDEAGSVGASVGLHALPATHALCGGSGTDNRVAIRSCRYDAQPLVIQGPGAGAEVTAAALLDDVIAIAA